MRVLMVSDVHFPRVNGVSTSIRTFREDLHALGCETVLVAPAYPNAEAVGDDREAVRVPSWRLPFDPEDRLMSGRALLEACRERVGGCDLVHVQTPFRAHRAGVRVAREAGIPVVETYHTFFEQYFHHYLPWLPAGALRRAARALSRNQCNAVDTVIAPSPQMAEALTAYGVTTPIEVIPTGLDPAAFAGGDGEAFRQRHGIAADRPVLLHVGRVAHEKNIGFLIEVLQQVLRGQPDTLLLIAGEGPARAALRRDVERRGLQDSVLFVGYLQRNTGLMDCYRCADAFVFASRTETQGLVLLEAMALGVPVVSTAVMGTRSVLERCGGAVIAEENPERFAASVLELLGDAPRRRQLGETGQRHVEQRWSAAAMARRLLATYRKLAPAAHGTSRNDRPPTAGVAPEAGHPARSAKAAAASTSASPSAHAQ